jgi:hypothetical protein
VRFTDSLVERAGPIVGPRIRNLLATIDRNTGAAESSNTEDTATRGPMTPGINSSIRDFTDHP